MFCKPCTYGLHLICSWVWHYSAHTPSLLPQDSRQNKPPECVYLLVVQFTLSKENTPLKTFDYLLLKTHFSPFWIGKGSHKVSCMDFSNLIQKLILVSWFYKIWTRKVYNTPHLCHRLKSINIVPKRFQQVCNIFHPENDMSESLLPCILTW